MLDTDEIKKNEVLGVELAPVETVGGQVKLGENLLQALLHSIERHYWKKCLKQHQILRLNNKN